MIKFKGPSTNTALMISCCHLQILMVIPVSLLVLFSLKRQGSCFLLGVGGNVSPLYLCYMMPGDGVVLAWAGVCPPRLCGGPHAGVYVNPPVTESSQSRPASPGTQEESSVLDYLDDFCFRSSCLPSCPMHPSLGILQCSPWRFVGCYGSSFLMKGKIK